MADRLTNSSPGPKSRKRPRQPSTEEAATTAADAVNPPPNPSTLTPGRKDDASSLVQDAGDRQNCSRQPKCRRLSPFVEEQTISVLPASSLGSLLDSPLSSASSCPSSSSSCPSSSSSSCPSSSSSCPFSSSCPSSSSSCPSSSSSCLEPIFEDFVVTCTSAHQQSLPLNRKRGLKRPMTSARTSTAANAENPPTQGQKDEASSLPQDAADHQSCSRQPKCRRLAPSMEEQTISVLPPSSLSPSSLGSLLEDPLSSASSCPSSSSSCPSSSSSCPYPSFSCPYPSFSCPSPSSCPFPSFCCPSSYFSYLCPSLSCPSPLFSSTSTEEPEMIVIVSDDEDDDDSDNSPIWEQLNTEQASFDLSPHGFPAIDLQNEIPEPPDLADVRDLREPNEVWPQPTSNPRMLTVETWRLPTKIFTSATHNHQTKCCVCTEEYIEGEELRVLPCFHAYHVKCIDTWLKVKKICPLCRLQLH